MRNKSSVIVLVCFFFFAVCFAAFSADSVDKVKNSDTTAKAWAEKIAQLEKERKFGQVELESEKFIH